MRLPVASPAISSSACCTTSVPTLIIHRDAVVASAGVGDGTVRMVVRAAGNRVATTRTAVAALAEPSYASVNRGVMSSSLELAVVVSATNADPNVAVSVATDSRRRSVQQRPVTSCSDIARRSDVALELGGHCASAGSDVELEVDGALADADESAPSGALLVRDLDGCGEFDEFVLRECGLDAGKEDAFFVADVRVEAVAERVQLFGLRAGVGGQVGGAAAEFGMIGEHAGDRVVGGRVVACEGREQDVLLDSEVVASFGFPEGEERFPRGWAVVSVARLSRWATTRPWWWSRES